MEQWKILVLGVLRLGLNADYERIRALANEYKTLRQMLGYSGWADGEEDRYGLQTIEDNLRLFTPEILDRINQEVVRGEHALAFPSLLGAGGRGAARDRCVHRRRPAAVPVAAGVGAHRSDRR